MTRTIDAQITVTSQSDVTKDTLLAMIPDYLEYRLSAGESVKTALQADPDCAFAHTIKGVFMMLFGSEQAYPKVDEAIAAAEKTIGSASHQEKAHLSALKAWRDGDTIKASLIWQEILADSPRDLLALRLHHFNAFWRGDVEALCAMPAATLSSWSKGTLGYGFTAGMLSFGLEEAGQYARAEELGREAAEINQDDLWTIHALAHVMEMQGRTQEGIDWMQHPGSPWPDRNPFKDHLHWHHALFHLESGDFDGVLDLYDTHIGMDPKAGFYLDVQNGASLLMRLELMGVDVGDRWEPLAEVASGRIDDRALLFTDPHVMMALVRAGRANDVDALLSHAHLHAAQAAVENIAARRLPALCEGLAAFGRGMYAQCVDTLVPIRHRLSDFGGSAAQRDIFSQILIAACLKANRTALAQLLLTERDRLKPNSVFARWARGTALG